LSKRKGHKIGGRGRPTTKGGGTNTLLRERKAPGKNTSRGRE